MEELTVLLFAIFIACLLFYLVFSGVQSYQSVKELQGAKRVLIITSHPDDEVMFFGPTILGLVRRCEVFLLCMSPGREAGHTRKRELFDSCRLLGIPDSNVILMRHTKLKDDPTVRWREELVSDIILRQVQLIISLMGKCIESSGSIVNLSRLLHCPLTLASPLTGTECPATETTSASTMHWPASPWRTERGACSASPPSTCCASTAALSTSR